MSKPLFARDCCGDGNSRTQRSNFHPICLLNPAASRHDRSSRSGRIGQRRQNFFENLGNLLRYALSQLAEGQLASLPLSNLFNDAPSTGARTGIPPCETPSTRSSPLQSLRPVWSFFPVCRSKFRRVRRRPAQSPIAPICGHSAWTARNTLGRISKPLACATSAYPSVRRAKSGLYRHDGSDDCRRSFLWDGCDWMIFCLRL